MGSVWRAVDLRMSRSVAIKRLHERGVETLQAFEREMAALARLHHPNLVTVFDTGSTADGAGYLVMEFVRGETLARLLERNGRLPVERACRIAAQLARGLSAAHEEGVVHRDLKPSNIMLSDLYGEHDWVTIVDFGVARLVDATQRTASGSRFIGTPQYASPEQARGNAATASSDLYCLGVILYEMLAGQPPFRAETAMGQLFHHVHSVAAPLSKLEPAVPLWLDELVQQLLAKEASSRARSATEVLQRIERATSQTSQRPSTTSLQRTPSVEPMAATLSAAGPSPPETTAAPSAPPAPRFQHWSERAKRASIAVLSLVGVAFVLLMVALTFPHALRRSSTASAPSPATPMSPTPPQAPDESSAIPSIVVDDFEDGDLEPKDRHFSRWERYRYNDDAGFAETWLQRGAGSNWALRLAWRVQDAPDGKNNFVGAATRVLLASGYIDLSKHTRLLFTHRYDPNVGWPALETRSVEELARTVGSGRYATRDYATARDILMSYAARLLPEDLASCEHSNQRAWVSMRCAEYQTSFMAWFDVSPAWKVTTIRFADLHQPAWGTATKVPVEDCLQVIDSLTFSLTVGDELNDGACHSGAFAIDSISFR